MITLDAIAPVEVQHDPERSARVAAQHVHERLPLPGRNRGEGVREELLASEATWLAMEIAGEMELALIVKHAELRRVRLPFTRRAVEIIERVADLVAHHVRGRGRLRADNDLPLAVGARARIPGGPPAGERDALERGHVVEFRDPARPDKDRVE